MQENFQDKLLQELKILVDPLIVAATDNEKRVELFKELGWDLESFDQSATSDLNSLLATVNSTYTTFSSLIQAPPQTFADLTDLLDAAKQLFGVINQLKNMSGGNLMAGFSDLGKDIVELLVVNYLESRQPVLFEVLVCLGLIRHADENLADTIVVHNTNPVIVRHPYRSHKLQLGNLSALLSNPATYIMQEYQIPSGNWQTEAASKASGLMLFGRLTRLLSTLGVDCGAGYKPLDGSSFGTTGNNISGDSMTLILSPQNSATVFGLIFSLSPYDRGDLGLVVTPFGSLTFDESRGGWNIYAKLSSTIPGFSIGHYGFEFPSTFNDARIGAELHLSKVPGANGYSFLVGSATGTRFEIGQMDIEGAFELSDAFREYSIGLKLQKAAFVLSPGDGDGFLQKILPAGGIASEFDLKINWSNIAGFHFEGSGSLELQLPIHKTILNSLTVDSLTVGIKAATGDLSLITAVTGSLELGPFKAVFEEVGIAFDFEFPPNKDGNLGVLDASVRFKPPTGLGLSLDTETIKGAGFLSFDEAASKYIGALELSIKDKIAVKAIGILTTKLPGNQPGYSLLLLITAEFQPIQLGFGFTLNGVGGLIALHRKMNFEALRSGVRNNTLNHILFPPDPVGNINNIISTLEETFPVEEGRFSFGPMAIIGWGSPTLITAELGLFIELPHPVRIALIGVIKALLPDENKRILQLQINFAGTIDFEAKFITFDASLFDSKLLWMALSGDMAFRLKWGDDAAFVLTVGGFYPGFPVPPLNLPTLRRITVNLLSGDNPRLTLSTYFAVTSNTAQFGAAVDFYYKYSNKISVSGGVSFDALFRFSPFYFSSTIKGNLSVYWKGKTIVSLWFEGSLEGPTPWHLEGSVGFKILRLSYSVNFSKTFGDRQTTTLPDIAVLPKLVAALQDKTNWQAQLPENIPQLVTVRPLPVSPGAIVVHPQGLMAVSQKVVPLGMQIARFGNQRPQDYSKFSFTLSQGANVYAHTDLKESFAAGEFFELSETDRLVRKSFEKYNSGVKVANVMSGLVSGGFREMPQVYEVITLDSRYRPSVVAANVLDDNTYAAFRRNNAAANSPLGSKSNPSSMAAPVSVTVNEGEYAIAQTYDLALYNNLKANSEAEAHALLDELLVQQPELEGLLNVIPSFELA